MLNKKINSVVLISVLMIIINFCGTIYMLFSKADVFAILMKIIYILLFLLNLFSLAKFPKKSCIISTVSTAIICIYSSTHYDFLTLILTIIFEVYAVKYVQNLNLKKTNHKH